MHQVLTHMLSKHISSSTICSVPDAYSQHVLKGLCLVHSLVPDTHAQCSYQFLYHMLVVYKMSIWIMGKLMRMVRVISWCAHSVHTSYAQPAHKRSEHARKEVKICKVRKTAKKIKIPTDTNKWFQRSAKNFVWPNPRKILLKIRLSISALNLNKLFFTPKSHFMV